ncbi:MAG: hypothetical protein IKD55_09720 [Sediminibacterium sp.]|nr:hypothetical protein [Sediminibacterium sp.]
MLDLEYLILKEYHFRKEFNTDEFHNYFKYLYRGIFSLDEIKKALGDLHSRNYLETTNGKFHTLNITDDGERFYSLNEGTLKWIGFYKEIFKDYDTTIINLMKSKYPTIYNEIWEKYRIAGCDLESIKTVFVQDLLREVERLPAEKPQYQPNKIHPTITISKMIVFCWNIISKNPLISTVIGGIIATLILKHYKII